MGACASRVAEICAVRSWESLFFGRARRADACSQGGEDDVDRDQLAALLQALELEAAVPRKTARAIRCGSWQAAGSSNLTRAAVAVRSAHWLRTMRLRRRCYTVLHESYAS